MTNKVDDLMRAVSLGKADEVIALIDGGADINAQDHSGLTPLMHAVKGDHIETARLLIERGADVNRKGKYLGYEAIVFAVKAGRAEMVELLLSGGLDPSTLNFATGVAKLTGNERVIDLLKQAAGSKD